MKVADVLEADAAFQKRAAIALPQCVQALRVCDARATSPRPVFVPRYHPLQQDGKDLVRIKKLPSSAAAPMRSASPS